MEGDIVEVIVVGQEDQGQQPVNSYHLPYSMYKNMSI